MASRAHVDNTVNERRLRPIYDWLDNGNNKKALQEAIKVLKKQPSNQVARVLKALALLRLGKEDECQVIMDSVRSEIPCDDSTLQAMSICYREIHQPEKIREVYEAAAKADPNNEELLSHLFMAYVRLGDFKRQQVTALALYKLKPKNPYYFWAVMSIVMQAVYADDKLAKSVMLPLAERMVLKLVGNGKLEAEQEVQLYLMILELQGKDEEVLEILSGPLASRLSSVPQRKATLLLQLQHYPEAATAFRELISQDLDNWAYYKGYLTAALKLQDPLECLEFLIDVNATNVKHVRAPYLARFELLNRVGTNDELRGKLDLVDLMRQYFAQFGEKGCVVSDLKMYLNLIEPAEQLELLQKIEEDVGVGPDEFPKTAGQMLKHIHYEQLRRLCGLHHSPYSDTEKRKLLAQRFSDLYDRGTECCPASERLPTDLSPADPYILIASHLLVQLWFETRDASHLYKAMALLEKGLASSPANFHLMIVLVRIYLETGLVGAADHVYTLLEAKQIQLDSLGWLHTPLLAPLGHLPRAATLLDVAAKFFLANYKQSADHLTFAYKYGSFVKIQEFIELKERLERSIHFAATTADKMLLELSLCESPTSLFNTLMTMRVQPQQDTIRWELLRDNRDLEVVTGWEPLDIGKPDPRMRDETRCCMLRLLSARTLILRILASTVESDSSSLLSTLATEIRKLNNELVPRCLEMFDVVEGDMKKAESVLVPIDALERLREAHDSDQLNVIASLADSLARSSRPDADCLQLLRTTAALKTLPLPDSDRPVSYKRWFLRASTCGETLAILSGMCVAFSTQSRPNAANKKKNKKLAKEIVSLTPDECQIWQEIGALLAEKIKMLETDLTELEKRTVQTNLPSDDEFAKIVADRCQDSVSQSCWPLKSRVQLTAKLLNGLRAEISSSEIVQNLKKLSIGPSTPNSKHRSNL